MTTEKLDRAARTVYENLVRAMLVHIRGQRKIWKLMNEQEQDELLALFDNDLRAAIRAAVDLVAAADMPHIKVTLSKVTFTDEVQGTIKMANTDELRHRLADAANKTVILVVPDYEAHLQGERPKGDSDQILLELGAVGCPRVRTYFAGAAVEDATNQAEREQAEFGDKANRKACYIDLLSLGFDHNEEEISSWSQEQVVEARAWIAAAQKIDDDAPMPDMPEFMAKNQPPAPECDGNHGGPPCADPECWNRE